MIRLSDLQARIQSLGQLQEVVTALRSVSAARLQQAHAVLDSIRQYTVVIQEALSDAARGSPLPPHAEFAQSRGCVIAFGSEHGFVGAFNERVFEHAAIQRKPGDHLLVIGSRAALIAAERREQVIWTCPMASHIGAIDDVALRVAEELSRAGAGADIGRVILVYTRSSGAATWRIVTETIVPFDLRPYWPRQAEAPPPLSNLGLKALLDGLVEELLFAQLTHAAVESFASESSARLSSMESAGDNVASKLDDLRRIERELRQEEITTELLDVITGAEAITNGG
jgi:F-type H+-transporting ATPase subunit gamma